ncbi:alpha/beta fold hydrolase [Rhizobium halophytocola]|uniref:Pimeloyl-ACP methyl ester carboxylesterase n=1 Tax=Rhizobium halophytocola TaxID=735519 RepID=A0ABS4DYT9_9HYPH|nr:alpha/beta hydrolase [Rhizobium halophytocola]MBP1850848.1 pimeloyl-ACP methyl ester carboxylesterase [Rhizobium halophytocola]
MADEIYRDHWFKTEDGLKIHARLYGDDGAAQTIICLPGLTRNGRDFDKLARRLIAGETRNVRVITIDSRGRGLSDQDTDESRYTLPVETGDVLSVCAELGIGKAIFIGTSRGGLVLHLIAALQPDLLGAVILNDIGPVIDIEGLRHIQDYLTRERLPPKTWSDAMASQKADHAAAFPALADDDWLELSTALYREIDGDIRPDYDPVIAEQMAAVDLSKPGRDLWPEFDGFGSIPMMVIRGENSTLLSEATVKAMAERHPGLECVTASGQGHPPLLHLEEIAAPIERFLQGVKHR